jgi:hypothetical protein
MKNVKKIARQILRKLANEIIVFHRTKNKKQILQNGFDKNKQQFGRFGFGFYFLENQNVAKSFGDLLKVKIKYKKIFIDENNDLDDPESNIGKEILKFAFDKNLIKDLDSSDTFSKYDEFIDKYMKYHHFDAIKTKEFGTNIYIIFEPTQIEILNEKR